MPTITIDKRYCGPPNSANGGYVSGLLANSLDGTAEITLRAPPPLERELELLRCADGTVELRNTQGVLATGRKVSLDLVKVPSAGLAKATAAAARTAYADPSTHPLPGCFVCGPGRAVGDGLRIFVGPLAAGVTGEIESVAAPWIPTPDLVDDKGQVSCEFIWAALDCPSGFACQGAGQFQVRGNKPILLGRMAAHIHRCPKPGDQCVIVAWSTGRDGRKLFSSSALLGCNGERLAIAQATWLIVERKIQLGQS